MCLNRFLFILPGVPLASFRQYPFECFLLPLFVCVLALSCISVGVLKSVPYFSAAPFILRTCFPLFLQILQPLSVFLQDV